MTATNWASYIASHLDDNFNPGEAEVRQVLCLAEEVGEFVGAYRRWKGMARRAGTRADMEDELADVLITARVTAEVLDVDLDAAVQRKLDVIFTRGWKEARTAA